MSDGSTIEWLDRPGTKPATWNPIVAYRDVVDEHGNTKRLRGWYCEHVHGGCDNCYSETGNLSGRFMGTKLPYKPGHRKDVTIELHEQVLLMPLKWRTPRTIFVESMSDLYGPWVKDEWLDKIKAVQALTPQHTYIELTKRPERMRDYNVARSTRGVETDRLAICMIGLLEHTQTPSLPVAVTDHNQNWPLPLKNVWGLVSCSTQEDADKFIPILLNTPLAIRGVSAEPLLGPMNLENYLPHRLEPPTWPKLSWIIIGGESGRNARPMHPDWVRSIKAQCETAGAAMFFKQWGEWAPHTGSAAAWPSSSNPVACTNYHNFYDANSKIERQVFRIGKTKAGRLLDGAEHNGFPQARTT